MIRGELRFVGPVAYEVVGSGGPVTAFVHGMAGTADDCRPWAAATPGTSLLIEMRGHGRSAPVPDIGWGYDDFATDLRSVMDAEGATSAVGVSAGAGALLRLLADTPTRLDQVVLALPPALDSPRLDASTKRLQSLGPLAEQGDIDGIAAGLMAELPEEVRDSRLARIWARRRASRLVSAPPPYQRDHADPPVTDVAALSAVTARSLVLGENDDPLHLASIAERVAAALPGAELEMWPHGSLFWTRRDEVAKRVVEHVTRPGGGTSTSPTRDSAGVPGS